MKRLIAAMLIALMGSGAMASEEGIIRVKTANDVEPTMDALVDAVTVAGASVFARLDHALGAESVGMKLNPSQVLIFGNPKIGTLAMQDNPLAGLDLPLRVLVYRDGAGQVWLTYEDPAHMLSGFDGIEAGSDYIVQMTSALKKLTAKAASAQP